MSAPTADHGTVALRAGLAEWRWTALSVVASVGLLAWLARVGADFDWLVALGDHLRRTGTLPAEVPFAAAPSDGWHNVPVLAELVLSVADQGGAVVAVAADPALVAATLLVVAARRRALGASDASTAWTVLGVWLGGISAFAVIRLQSLSYLPLMVALLAAQSRRPDRRIWWAPVLVVVWGSLHGAVLLGVRVLGAYLLAGRLARRPLETLLVGVASLLALLVTPQGWRTPA